MRKVGLVLISLGIVRQALGFVAEVNEAGRVRRWALNPPDSRVATTAVNRNTRAIIYHLDAAGYSTTNTAAELDAIRASFDQWQAVPGTVLKFEEGAVVSGTTDVDSQDGVNTFFWTRDLFVNGGRDNLSGVVALTYVASYSDNNVIADADTVFNGGQYRWFTDASTDAGQSVFIEAITLHELGHFLGLRHSPIGGATMLFIGDFGVNSQVGLSEDEYAAARALYGTTVTSNAHGRITGTVRLNGTALFGAAVFASDTQGNVVGGTVTRSNGVYELGGLLPGTYTVRAAPLDGTGSFNYLLRGADIAGTYASAATQFHPSADKSVSVTAGKATTSNIEVTSGEPMRIVRVTRPAPDLSQFTSYNKPVSVQPLGQTVYVGVYTESALDGEVELSIPGDGLTLGATETRPNAIGPLSLAAVPVTIATNATPGLRSFQLRRGTSVAWLHGFLEISSRFPDVNRDGLDDQFQRRYWTRFTGAEAAPLSDPDGDGFNNAWEFMTDSVPTNRLSAHFEILSVQVSAEGARVRAQTAAGKSFQLMTRETVPGSEWSATGNPVVAQGNETEFLDRTATRDIQFYRVQLLP